MRLFRTIVSSVAIFMLIVSVFSAYSQTRTPYQDTHLPVDERVTDLLKQLTLEEKIQLLGYNSKGVPRLGIPVYNWWNEALHGVARAGEATVFPQAIALAATFNDELQQNIADVISTEARAKYNLAVKQDRRIQYMGLTFWSPNINIFRDPRWGRGQETYGEDPYLTSRMGKAFVKGLQGNDPHYLKTSACAKHFAVHSGPEANRHTFNAIVDEKDLRETYLYAFHELVNGGVESVMCGYNRVNDEPCCTGNTLLHKILREEWKFKGHVVTDCWALEDIWRRHKVIPDAVHVAAAAVKVGVNMDCSNMLQDDLLKAVQQKLITEKEIEQALIPSLRTQFKLGFYDDPALVPYHSLGAESVHNAHNIEQARLAAQQSMVLLKNDKNILPLSANKYGSILVTGANAASLDALLGNYHGVSSNTVTFVEGITRAAGPATAVQYDLGCNDVDSVHFGGLWASETSDVTIAVLGLTPVSEGEEGDAFLAAHGGDKADLSIPASHLVFLKALRKKHNKPIIAVITAGSAVDINAIAPYADAVVLAWYSGEQGGNALADILFGKVSPSGRLPVTFYNSFDDLPAYDSYATKGRTYRYFTGKVQYPFGFGLSYTQFAYEWKQKPKEVYKSTDIVSFTATIKNTGAMDGDEVVQAYIKYPSGERMPLKELKQFKRVHVAAGNKEDVSLNISIADLQKWNLKSNAWEVVPGKYTVFLGGNSQDEKLTYTFTVKK
ncbi:MAG TPA: glycoside hydrolase family 3 N-terminal domain-containing protein [Ohtaekwangia sp.]|uniref:glycoside hydrolase family 3 N-terminal domain-containing protein n=1 Tax=Ohtaekwangia sp. TaxID=2066019 RepID=UPI002F958199